MNAKISIIIMVILSSICLKGQIIDSIDLPSKELYKSFNMSPNSKENERKFYNKDSVLIYRFKNDEFRYEKIDTINVIEINKDEIDDIHFWEIYDEQLLQKKLGIDILIEKLKNEKELASDQWEQIVDYLNYHQNFYIIEKIGDKYYKVFVRRNRKTIS